MNNSRAQTISAVAVFVVAVAALVALEITGHSTSTLMVLVGPVVAALFINGHTTSVTTEQNSKIDKIERQTNGVLDERIRTQTLAALTEAGVVQALDPAPLPRVDTSVVHVPSEGDPELYVPAHGTA